jgi:hypothetical protein
MIPASHWHDNGDGTVWVVFNVIAPEYDPWTPYDRPCDTCHGARYDRAIAPCPDCDGTGRHTFTIEVDDGEYPLDRPLDFRCSVVPGMVLPIVDQDDGCPDTPHVCLFCCCLGGEEHQQWWYYDGDETEEEITPPPAAAPGMFAVLLKVQS